MTHGVEPHLVDVVAILILRQLNTPFATIFVRLILPRRDNTLLKIARIIVRTRYHTDVHGPTLNR